MKSLRWKQIILVALLLAACTSNTQGGTSIFATDAPLPTPIVTVIPAPNAEAAHKFIDFLMRADIAARNSNYLRYPNGNKASFDLLDAEIRNDPSLYPSADTYERLFMAEMFTDDALRALNKSWTHVKTGQ